MTRNCEYCQRSFTHNLRNVRFCSTDCGKRAWMKKHRELMRAVPKNNHHEPCEWCKGPIKPSMRAGALFCSKKCRAAADHARRRSMETVAPRPNFKRPRDVFDLDEPTPDLWDGTTIHSPQPALKWDWEGHCLGCGAVWYLYRTEAEIRRLQPMHCRRCGNRVLVECAEYGTLHAMLARIAA